MRTRLNFNENFNLKAHYMIISMPYISNYML